MKILDFSYNEDSRTLYVEFSLNEDGDDYYRSIWLSMDEITYYSPSIIQENDLFNIDEEFLVDLLNGYLEENEPPEEKSL
jgi:hypothetical protein